MEKLSVFLSIYLLLSLSMVLFVSAKETAPSDETRPFTGSITIKNLNDPRTMVVITDKYSKDALTDVTIDAATCKTKITCGEPTCETPYSEVTDDEETPVDDSGEGKTPISICDYINDEGKHITLVLDPKRWTIIGVKYVSDTELEYYLMDQRRYSIVFTETKGNVRIYTIQSAERLKKIVTDAASVTAAVCSADLLSDARIKCNEQMMDIYAIVATYWYLITHFSDFVMASTQTYIGVCDLMKTLKSKFGDLFDKFKGQGGKYADMVTKYGDKVKNLASGLKERYDKYAAYVKAAMSCKEAYEYVKKLYDNVLGLIDKVKGYLSFLKNPVPSCLSDLMDKLRALINKLKALTPTFIPELDDFFSKINGLFPDCIQNFLVKLDDFKNLLGRFLALTPNYCNKVQAMKEYYGDRDRGNDPAMAKKYADLYLPCEDGEWLDLSFPGIDCTGLKGLTTDILPENCQKLYGVNLPMDIGLSIDLPDSCKDLKSILKNLVFCKEIDLDNYKDEFPDIPENKPVTC